MNQGSPPKPPFNSNEPRNIATLAPSNVPGPGAYSLGNGISHLKPVRRQKHLPLHGFDWIFSEPRAKALEVYENNKHVGPDTYEVQVSSKAPKYSWGKSSRFEENQEAKAQIGPGYYNLEERRDSPGAQAAFRSRVPKNIDNNSSDSSLPARKSISQLQYEIQQKIASNSSAQLKPVEQKKQKPSFFGSKAPRFVQKDLSPTKNVGPGTYTLEVSDIKIRRSLTKPLQPEKPKVSKEIPLGPGSYDLSNFSFSKSLDKKGYPISKETRFNFQGKKAHSTILPGPGQYMQEKYLYANREQLFKGYQHQHRKLRSVSHAIIGDRPLSNKKTAEFYDVKVFDISYELEKKKFYYQNLKELKVQLAPFDSKATRLP